MLRRTFSTGNMAPSLRLLHAGRLHSASYDIIHNLTAVAGSEPEASAKLLQEAAEAVLGPPSGFLRLYREQLGLEVDAPQVRTGSGSSVHARPFAYDPCVPCTAWAQPLRVVLAGCIHTCV